MRLPRSTLYRPAAGSWPDPERAEQVPTQGVQPREPKMIPEEYRGVREDGGFSEGLHGPIFEPLKDRGYFQRFFLEGGTVAWSNGADVAPEIVYERVKSSETA